MSPRPNIPQRTAQFILCWETIKYKEELNQDRRSPNCLNISDNDESKIGPNILVMAKSRPRKM